MSSSQRAAPKSPWLKSAPFDLALYTGVNVVGAAMVLLLARSFEPERIWIVFNICFTVAHYAPTWIRAFCDRSELRRNGASIALFPLAFFAFLYATRGSPIAAAFVLYLWDRYHALMQSHGFMRLYDAKAGRTSKWAGRFELGLLGVSALLIASFNMGLVSPLLLQLARLGVHSAPDAGVLFGVRAVLGAATLVMSVIYLVTLVRDLRAGRPVSLPKQLFLLSVIGGHVLMNLSTDVYLLSAHEKVYHSIQYGALVWQYNQRRVASEGGPSKAGLLGWFAGRRGLFTYVAAIVLWTFVVLLLLPSVAPQGSVAGTPAGAIPLIAGLALAHYYFDSFLWKVRRPEVRANL